MTAVEWALLGYHGLLPVAPPGAIIAPGSRLRAETLGKAPAILRPDGWAGYDWIRRGVSPARIDSFGGSIGIRTRDFVVVDIDVLDERFASFIQGRLGALHGINEAMRVGRWPKRAFIYRLVGEPISRMQLHIQYAGQRHLVELLGDGQQAVIEGRHPGTGRPYQWLSRIPASELPTISREQAVALFAALREELELLGAVVSSVGSGAATERPVVDQASLQTTVERLRTAVEAIPNTPETYPSRDSYIALGTAIKAASVNYPEEGYQIWFNWAMQWPTATAEVVEGDWRRMHPPFSLGADYVFAEARRHGRFDADEEFEAVPGGTEAREDYVQYSDLWLADRLITAHGEHMRWVGPQDQWYAYSTERQMWVPGQDLVTAYSISVCRQEAGLAARVLGNRSLDRARSLASARAVDAAVRLSRADAKVAAAPDTFDADPNLLGVPGGAIDLRTGEFLPGDPRWFISRSTICTPSSDDCPTWRKFLLDSAGGDQEMIDYYQRALGYVLTGRTDEQVFFYLYGSGGNGKGTFLNTVQRILSGYAKVAPIEVFMSKNNPSHPTSLAALVGARMVLAQELRAGQKWDEQVLKMLTGGDDVTARYMYQDEFTYRPAFKLLFSGNHYPRIRTVDHAMVRRTQIWPWTLRPEIVDKQLGDRLAEEYHAILGWLIRGAQDWYANGLVPPAAIRSQTESYLREEDTLGQWIDERCDRGDSFQEEAGALFVDFASWCSGRGFTAGAMPVFAKRLTDRGLGTVRDGAATYRQGLRLRPEFGTV